MLSRVKYVCEASKGQDFINRLKQRCLTTARFQLSSSGNRPCVDHVILGLNSRMLSYHSTLNLYHLEKHRLIFNAAMRVRKFAKDSKVPSMEMENHSDQMKNSLMLKREIERLKLKGVMKDMPVKIPEAITELKRTKEGH